MNITQEAAERQIKVELTVCDAAATPRGRKTELYLKLVSVKNDINSQKCRNGVYFSACRLITATKYTK